MSKTYQYLAVVALATILVGCNKDETASGAPKRPECIAPAKPGGGFDLTCKLAQQALKDINKYAEPMRVTVMT